MGHAAGKDIYQKLGSKIDSLTVRTPWNDSFFKILKELYSEEEAQLIVKMPFSLSAFDRIMKITAIDEPRLHELLERLCAKGLIIDFWVEEKYWYMPSPLVVGIFEMTMMRMDQNARSAVWANMFKEYMGNEFWGANFGNNERVSFMRTLVHEEAINKPNFVEILDYESAVAIVEQSKKFAIGTCSCRHEKFHLEEKSCSTPLDTCSSFGKVADYLIRHNFAKEVSKSQMLENVARSKELKLVLSADNIRESPTFICHCCKCCCGVLLGITKHGYPNDIVTSTYVSNVDEGNCNGCGLCVKGCPVNAIEIVAGEERDEKIRSHARVNSSTCLGCGVCGLICRKDAITMVKRKKKTIHPATTFERIILQSLERGTLQNQLFDNPSSISHTVMRGILGGFFRLSPVKKALMSDLLRSVFLSSMKAGARIQGRDLIVGM